MAGHGTYQSVDTDDSDDYDRSQRPGQRDRPSPPSLYERLVAQWQSTPARWQSLLLFIAAALLASTCLLLVFSSFPAQDDSSASSQLNPLQSSYLKPLTPPTTITRSTAFSPPSTSNSTYLGLTLPNHLEVLLISSPSSPLSSASFAVGCGSWTDPSSHLGRAHLLEHMLFLGTTSHPTEGEWSDWLTAHGGYSNAYTAEDRTVYFYTVSHSAMSEAVDRFGEFFSAPLLRAESMEREVRAVNAEHEKNVQNDEWRLYELLKATSAAGHPFHQFGTGNLHTLRPGNATHTTLSSLYERCYVARNSKLVLLSPEPIEQLQKYAVDRFTELRDTPLYQPDNYSSPAFPLSPEYVGRVVYIQPISELHQLSIYFPLNTSYTLQWRTSPLPYIASLLGQEQPGSLLSIVKAEGWGDAVSVGVAEDEVGLNVLQVQYQLNAIGVFHWEKLLARTFEYIALIESSGVDKSRWDEMVALQRITYEYGETPSAADITSALSARLLSIPMPDVLQPPSRREWDETEVRHALAELRPNVSIAHVVSASFEDKLFTEREHVYGTRYTSVAMSAELVKLVTRAMNEVRQGKVEGISLPEPNPYVFDLLDTRSPAELSSSTSPAQLSATTSQLVWYERDDSFPQPKAVLYIDLLLPSHSLTTLANLTRTTLYLRLVASSFQSQAYLASLAGYSYTFTLTASSILIRVSGLTEKLSTFAAALVSHLVDPPITPAVFQSASQSMAQQLSNIRSSLAYQQAVYWLEWWVGKRSWRWEEVKAELETVKVEEMDGWGERLLHGSGGVRMEVLGYGRLDESMVRHVTADVEKQIKLSTASSSSVAPTPRLSFHRPHDVLVPPVGSLVYQHPILNAADNNAAVLVHFPIAPFTNRTASTLLDLTTALLAADAFNVLRTQQQLGYIVAAFASLQGEGSTAYRALNLVVQGVEVGAAGMDERVETFMWDWVERVKAWQPTEWKERVAGRIETVQRRKEQVEQAGDEVWLELVTGRRWWQRVEDEVVALQELDQADYVAWYETNVLGPGRRRLSLEVVNVKDEVRSKDGSEERLYALPAGRVGAGTSDLLTDASRAERRAVWSKAL